MYPTYVEKEFNDLLRKVSSQHVELAKTSEQKLHGSKITSKNRFFLSMIFVK